MSGVPPSNGRPPMAVAMEWVSRATTMSLSLALPALAGYWADQKWGLLPWLTIAGAIVGFAMLLSQLLQFARQSESRQEASRRPPGPTDP